jgi:hypothetical protein
MVSCSHSVFDCRLTVAWLPFDHLVLRQRMLPGPANTGPHGELLVMFDCCLTDYQLMFDLHVLWHPLVL